MWNELPLSLRTSLILVEFSMLPRLQKRCILKRQESVQPVRTERIIVCYRAACSLGAGVYQMGELQALS